MNDIKNFALQTRGYLVRWFLFFVLYSVFISTSPIVAQSSSTQIQVEQADNGSLNRTADGFQYKTSLKNNGPRAFLIYSAVLPNGYSFGLNLRIEPGTSKEISFNIPNQAIPTDHPMEVLNPKLIGHLENDSAPIQLTMKNVMMTNNKSVAIFCVQDTAEEMAERTSLEELTQTQPNLEDKSDSTTEFFIDEETTLVIIYCENRSIIPISLGAQVKGPKSHLLSPQKLSYPNHTIQPMQGQYIVYKYQKETGVAIKSRDKTFLNIQAETSQPYWSPTKLDIRVVFPEEDDGDTTTAEFVLAKNNLCSHSLSFNSRPGLERQPLLLGQNNLIQLITPSFTKGCASSFTLRLTLPRGYTVTKETCSHPAVSLTTPKDEYDSNLKRNFLIDTNTIDDLKNFKPVIHYTIEDPSKKTYPTTFTIEIFSQSASVQDLGIVQPRAQISLPLSTAQRQNINKLLKEGTDFLIADSMNDVPFQDTTITPTRSQAMKNWDGQLYLTNTSRPTSDKKTTTTFVYIYTKKDKKYVLFDLFGYEYLLTRTVDMPPVDLGVLYRGTNGFYSITVPPVSPSILELIDANIQPTEGGIRFDSPIPWKNFAGKIPPLLFGIQVPNTDSLRGTIHRTTLTSQMILTDGYPLYLKTPVHFSVAKHTDYIVYLNTFQSIYYTANQPVQYMPTGQLGFDYYLKSELYNPTPKFHWKIGTFLEAGCRCGPENIVTVGTGLKLGVDYGSGKNFLVELALSSALFINIDNNNNVLASLQLYPTIAARIPVKKILGTTKLPDGFFLDIGIGGGPNIPLFTDKIPSGITMRGMIGVSYHIGS